MRGLMNHVGATMRPQIYVFSRKILILATEGAFFCALSHLISNFFLQVSHSHLQPDHHSICISMLYEKNGLMDIFQKLFGGSRSAKRHVHQNPTFFSNFAVLQSSLISHQLISFNMIN